jgi:hypothetical protein
MGTVVPQILNVFERGEEIVLALVPEIRESG